MERFNRTLKTKMWRYFTHKNTYRYTNVLQTFLKAYNHTKHRSIGMAPVDVIYSNENDVHVKLYGAPVLPSSMKYKFKVNDHVRISKYKHVFEKGYLPNWTIEIFTIAEQIPRDPPVYRIKDYQNTVIEGTFYEDELQKVGAPSADATYVVEKILQRKNKNGQDYMLVKWHGYPKSMNSWIPAQDLIQLGSVHDNASP